MSNLRHPLARGTIDPVWGLSMVPLDAAPTQAALAFEQLQTEDFQARLTKRLLTQRLCHSGQLPDPLPKQAPPQSPHTGYPIPKTAAPNAVAD